MIKELKFHISELDSMKKYPSKLFYNGNLELLKKQKISIVGTRRPSLYTKQYSAYLSRELSKQGICIVSGGAMGVDAIAHKNAKEENTIAVMANGLDIRYPQVNKSLIESIEKNGLVLSQFEAGFRATPWSFVVRNELVVALGDILIVTEADIKSGSMRSVEFALEMQKPIYVLPHRIGESEGTNYLIKNNLAKVIFDMDAFVASFGLSKEKPKDELLEFCKKNPTLAAALYAFGDKVYEYELKGYIDVKNNIITILR